MDGIDLAVIRTDGGTVGGFGPEDTVPYDSALRDRLGGAVADPDALGAGEREALERDLTDAHAAAVEGFLARHGLDRDAIGVVGFHGHTLVHRPERRLTAQLGDGGRLARRIGIDVVNDFRAADVAAGGEGAPLAPLYHAALAKSLPRPLAVLNLGGVGNVTFIDDGGDGDAVLAFDTGPGNAMIDDWVRARAGLPFDADGRLAASGRVRPEALGHLLADPYFARPAPKSLDRNAFKATALEGLSAADGAATLAAFTAGSVAAALPHLPSPPRRWLVTGGGRRNPVVMAALGRNLGAPVDPVEAVGWSGDALEAQAFAYLAVRSLYGLPLSLPTTTGVPAPATGGALHRVRGDGSGHGAPALPRGG